MRRFLAAIAAGYLGLLLILFAVPRLQKDGQAPPLSQPSGAVPQEPANTPLNRKSASMPKADAGEKTTSAEAKSVRTLYRSGQVSSVWIFQDAQLSGESMVYHENGNIWMKIPFEKGREQGTVKIYDEAGVLSASLLFSSGLLEGRAQHFYPDGSLWSLETWEKGVMETLPVLYSERQPVPAAADTAQEKFPQEERREIYKTFYAGGTVSGEWNALGGKLHGTAKRFLPSGRPLSEQSFEAGSREGPELIYDSDARLRYKAGYSKGEREGPVRLYYPDGSVLAEIPYHLGRLSDEPRFYSEGRVRPASPQDI